MPYRIQLAKMTRLKRSSYFPESTNRHDQRLSTTMETLGVRCSGWMRATDAKKSPSLAAAYGTRAPERMEPLRAAKMLIMAPMETIAAPGAPAILLIISAATRV